MKPNEGLKPQDLLLLLKIVGQKDSTWRMADMAYDLGVAQSEISFGLQRARASRLLDHSKKKVQRGPLLEFLEHGVKYVYPAEPGRLCRGIPTAHSAPPLSKAIVSKEPYVWPHEEGTVRGQAINPIYRSVPTAAQKDPKLYEMLALVDALRVGRAREVKLAVQELKNRLIDQMP